MNTKPFEIRTSKSSIFKCLQYSNGWYSDSHCISLCSHINNIVLKELEYLRTTIGVTTRESMALIPWKSMFTSKAVWAIIVAHFAENWGFYTLLTGLPMFLTGWLYWHISTRVSLQFCKIQLFKLHNSTNMSEDWVSLNFQQNFNARNNKIQIFNDSNYKVGQNLLVNRFKLLSNKIDYHWLNESLNSYKIKCKNLFLN